MSDEPVIAGPVEVLHLARVCPDLDPPGARFDLDQLRFGRFPEGDCWAAATDSKALAVASWPSGDDTTAPPGTEFGVPADLLAPLADLLRRKRPWRPYTLAASPAGVTVRDAQQSGSTHRVIAARESGKWPAAAVPSYLRFWRERTRPKNPDAAGDIDHRYLARAGEVFARFGGSVFVRTSCLLLGGPKGEGVYCFNSGQIDRLPGVSLWVFVMCLTPDQAPTTAGQILHRVAMGQMK